MRKTTTTAEQMVMVRPLSALVLLLETPQPFAHDPLLFRRAQLLNFILLTLTAVMSVAALFNLLVIGDARLALIELAMVTATLLALWRFRRHASLQGPAWLASSTAGAMLLYLIVHTQGDTNPYVLLLLYPLFVYPLHGLRAATLAYLLFVAAVLAIFVYGWGRWSISNPAQTLFNITIALLIGGGIIYYYEHTREAALNRVRILSMTDPLTGIWNRTMFDEMFTHEIAVSRRQQHCFSLILLDLDHFKRINDEYGHDIGDAVLREFAQLLTTRTRASDSLSRWGGEEFALILPNTDLNQAEVLARTLLKTIRAHHYPRAGRVTASMGVGTFCPNSNRETFFRAIDQALYRAKHQGRDGYALATTAAASD
ncbi:GGDEF domain-containing protein [Marichromatium bheemlicum]|uniref:diguanylate cyclase n=1 Tax=Marichromatium bheemlicum TaxID=365339 RepID=A0ABX1I3T6_9GAMM|nr:GGDEF domain-containing protein [Marichromatium bheemlicum]NKN32199.1 GGDEF domain-containing protein [Marichromatium bheemlicum]